MEKYELATIIVNYNSNHILPIVRLLLKGLDALSNLISLKLVIVDNNSSDESIKEIEKYIREETSLDSTILRLRKNHGYSRAVNLAYRVIKKHYKTKYIGILNNDIVINPKNTIKVLQYLEYSDIAGVQGTIMQLVNPDLIDNAGFMIDQHGLTYPVCRGRPITCARLYTPSYLSGACSFYKISIINEMGVPFDDYIDSYYDDKYLGIMLWKHGYKVLHVPKIVAYHMGSASYADTKKRLIKSPKWFRGIVMADLIPATQIKDAAISRFIRVQLIKIQYGTIGVIADTLTKFKGYTRAFIEACRVARYYTSTPSNHINLKNINIIKRCIPIRFHMKGIELRA